MTMKTAPTPAPAYTQDPLFIEAMKSFQSAQWTEGLDRLGQLQSRYPGEKDLSTLYAEMGIRSTVDQYEKEEDRRAAIRKVLKAAVIGILLVAVIVSGWWSLNEYASYVQTQVDSVRQAAEQSARELETFARFRDAQSLMVAGRSTEALTKFREIQQIMPDYPNLDVYIAQAEAMADIENEYNRALILYSEEKFAEALEIFSRINQTNPNYLDVQIRIDELERYSNLEALLKIADSAYDQRDWENAIADYNKIKALDKDYQVSYIDRRLSQSYLNHVEDLVSPANPDLDSLMLAESQYAKALKVLPRDTETAVQREDLRRTLDQKLYTAYIEAANQKLAVPNPSLLEFSAANSLLERALALRPDDQELILRTRTARNYLQAVDEYYRSNWDMSIQLLDSILLADPNYAWGAGLQLMYDSLMERGMASALNDSLDDAISDFQKAEKIAGLMSGNQTAVLMAQLEQARVYGIQFRTDKAISMYEEIIAEYNLLEIASERNPDLYQKLLDAETLHESDDDEGTYKGYRDAFIDIVSLMDIVEVTSQPGDYLSWLAYQYGSTSDLIQKTSKLLSHRLDQGEKLSIPYFNGVAQP